MRVTSAGRNWAGPWRKTPGRLLGTGLVRLYQLTLSGFIGNSCRHLPTCSEYAYEAIARHGLWNGGWILGEVCRFGRRCAHPHRSSRGCRADPARCTHTNLNHPRT
jgi:putative membrane protein insertion efficiency factor